MSMMGSTGVTPMDQLADMRGSMGQQGPIGPNQGMGGPVLGAPVANNPQAESQVGGGVQELLDRFAQAGGMAGGDKEKLIHHLRQLQKMYPKLVLADHKNGHAEMVGPAQEQFLAAAYARLHGAKTAHVRNNGHGQRLHVEF